MKTVSVSTLRNSISDVFAEVIHHMVPVAVTRYEKERAFLIGEDVLRALLDTVPTVFSPKLEEMTEEDGTVTLLYQPLDLLANASSREEALDDILMAARDYADDYLDSLPIFLRDAVRRVHFPLVMLIAQAGDDVAALREILGI